MRYLERKKYLTQCKIYEKKEKKKERRTKRRKKQRNQQDKNITKSPSEIYL